MLSKQKMRARALEEPQDEGAERYSAGETQILALLISLREEAGISKTELARRLGITPPAINRLEKRPAQASFSTLARYAEACGFRLYLNYI
ncbi:MULTISPECIES: helix-turn-helix transcriptional regulator [unclassified Erwinia]|uniref:helix-turn-helix domain-containing protein n=1 Tax=unclassified Erwinia TaxID=2622719 RepID=UPI00082D8348|nr:helix-turn-helix transcriptional regulator [Erwinia sp. ErVv1]